MVDLASFFRKSHKATMITASTFNTSATRSFIIGRRFAGGTNSYTRITPDPIISNLSPGDAESIPGLRNLTVEVPEFRVSGISKTLNSDDVFGSGTFYLIDAELVDGEPEGGFIVDAIQGWEPSERELDYELLLKRRPLRQ